MIPARLASRFRGFEKGQANLNLRMAGLHSWSLDQSTPQCAHRPSLPQVRAHKLHCPLGHAHPDALLGHA